ncbi:MAG: hypothetical protein KDA89_18555, partial [Planctomycetaceae bacterium]|nr:hypothetical protein [Planctomycetaceae bacterium]
MSTTRAYTIKLAGPSGLGETNSDCRELLWKTHVTANRGVQVWGDWLLTLRGGLPASLVQDDSGVLPVSEKDVNAAMTADGVKGKAKEERFTEYEYQLKESRRDNLRTLLALSWLSVEAVDKDRAETLKHQVATGAEETSTRVEKVLGAFQNIL